MPPKTTIRYKGKTKSVPTAYVPTTLSASDRKKQVLPRWCRVHDWSSPLLSLDGPVMSSPLNVGTGTRSPRPELLRRSSPQ